MSLHPLELLKSDEWDRAKGEERLLQAGFGGGPFYQFACTGAELGECLDQITWSLDGRIGLLDDQIREIGIGAYVETQGLALIINLASD